jgi:hypothetical protein
MRQYRLNGAQQRNLAAQMMVLLLVLDGQYGGDWRQGIRLLDEYAAKSENKYDSITEYCSSYINVAGEIELLQEAFTKYGAEMEWR